VQRCGRQLGPSERRPRSNRRDAITDLEHAPPGTDAAQPAAPDTADDGGRSSLAKLATLAQGASLGPRSRGPVQRGRRGHRERFGRLADWRPGWLRLGAGVLAGLLLWTSFPPLAWWPAAVPAVTLLTLAVADTGWRRGLVVGFGFGLALFVPLLSWLHVVTPLAWFVLAFAESGYLAAFGAGLAVIAGRLTGWPVWAGCLWVAEELVRARWPLDGFTWGRLAFSQPDTPFTGLAALAGAPLVTFAVALCGSLLALAVRSVGRARGDLATTRRGSARLAASALLVALAVPSAALAVPRPTSGTPLQVAVVQGNVPQPGTHFLGRAEEVLHYALRENAKLAAGIAAGQLRKPQIVLWSENASDVDPLSDASVRAAIQQAVSSDGVPVLVGAVLDVGTTHVSNTGIVWDPVTGPGAEYSKRHLVPFGEYIPWRGFVSHLTSLTNLVPRNFVPGHRPGVLDVGPARIADVICFEVAFDDQVRAGVRGGGQLIVVQTNNATYMHTALTRQQLAMSQLRAVEHGRAVVIAAISGISAVISPDGHVVTQTKEMTPALIDEAVPLRSRLTLADHLGAWPEWAIGILGVLSVLAGAMFARAGRRR
jgi:apolipoprotein N-acyltransferase